MSRDDLEARRYDRIKTGRKNVGGPCSVHYRQARRLGVPCDGGVIFVDKTMRVCLERRRKLLDLYDEDSISKDLVAEEERRLSQEIDGVSTRLRTPNGEC